MNSVGLNVFIAVVGITAGPGFVAGLQQLGFSLFLWGIFATTVPLIMACSSRSIVFQFDRRHPARHLRRRAHDDGRARHDLRRAKSQVPGLGYTVTYAVGNTLLTIWGMVIVMLLT